MSNSDTGNTPIAAQQIVPIGSL